LPSDGFFRNLVRTFQKKPPDLAEQPPTPKLDFILGAEPREKLDPWWWLVAAVFVLLVLLMALKPDPYWDIFLFVRDGLAITVELTAISFVFIIIVGLIGGLGRIAKNPVIHFIATIYVEVIRGIPLLVQLIWWYFAAPVIIQDIGRLIHFSMMENYHANPLFLAVVGLVICYGAYMAEIFRAGIQSIPKGQMEASRSLGMTYMQSMTYVILPQAIRVVLPPVGNEFIMLLKDTSLVSVVAVADLTRRGREFMASHFNPLEVWTLIALLYLILTLVSARFIAWLEKRRKY
jgi:polar amino acid transport system permease protein